MKRKKKEIILPEIPTEVAKLIIQWKRADIDFKTIFETFGMYYSNDKEKNGDAINYLLDHPDQLVIAYLYDYTTKDPLKYKVAVSSGEVIKFEEEKGLITWEIGDTDGVSFDKHEAERVAIIVNGEIKLV